jgi:DNA (cytosine-5)-methyltransferase 1
MKYIDLFAGAGGLSEGFLREGFEPVAHVEMNSDACYTIKTRMAYDFLCKAGKLDIYKDYLKGKITREQLYNEVPNDIIDSVINKTISKETIETIFKKIDDLLGNDEIDF